MVDDMKNANVPKQQATSSQESTPRGVFIAAAGERDFRVIFQGVSSFEAYALVSLLYEKFRKDFGVI